MGEKATSEKATSDKTASTQTACTLVQRVRAIRGEVPCDLIVRGAQVVDVLGGGLAAADVAVLAGTIVCLGDLADLHAAREVDAAGRYLLPGFVDAHMHLESSMLTPGNFARVALACGTTTCLADPHEIANVMGQEGVRELACAAAATPLDVRMCAPSTIPSAPGLEGSGWSVGAAELAQMLDALPVSALGEVMDFNAVAAGDPHILGVVAAAQDAGLMVDGHASLLDGRGLQAFRAVGITSDHTVREPAKLLREVSLGFSAQVQDCNLSAAMVEAIRSSRFADQLCLVTDDVPLSTLMHQGHLNHVVAHAVELGLDPVLAARLATINPARRLGLADRGAVAPGMRADLQLVSDLRAPRPDWVWVAGQPVVEEGAFVADVPASAFAAPALHTMRVDPPTERDFRLAISPTPPDRAPTDPVPSDPAAPTTVTLRCIHTDGASFRTTEERRTYPLHADADGTLVADVAPDLTMAVLNRHGAPDRSLGVVTGMPGVCGAVATTYAHDSHNLVVYGGGPHAARDMALAARRACELGGGLVAARDGRVVAQVPLPIAGLMSPEGPEALLAQVDDLLAAAVAMGFAHERLLSFFTLGALAVSPELKLGDRGLVDVANRRLVPLVVEGSE